MIIFCAQGNSNSQIYIMNCCLYVFVIVWNKHVAHAHKVLFKIIHQIIGNIKKIKKISLYKKIIWPGRINPGAGFLRIFKVAFVRLF